MFFYCKSNGKWRVNRVAGFSIKDFFSKCDQIRRKTTNLVTFTEEILDGKLHFLCSVNHVTIYRVKFLDIVNLKILPPICFRDNS